MVKISDLAFTSLETITAFDINSKAYLFTLDELQNASLAQGEEKIDITGKQGRKITSLKRNKTLTVSGSNGVVSAGMLEMQTGSAFKNETTNVMWYDYITVETADTAETEFIAVGTAGNEIKEVLIKDANGFVEKVLTQADAAADGKFAYDPETRKISFAAGSVPVGTEIIVNYERNIVASVLENMSDTYSSKAILYIDLMAEDKCNNVYRVQIKVPKADFSGEFSLEFGDNQTVQSFEAEGLAGACGSNGMLWSWTVFGADAEDAA